MEKYQCATGMDSVYTTKEVRYVEDHRQLWLEETSRSAWTGNDIAAETCITLMTGERGRQKVESEKTAWTPCGAFPFHFCLSLRQFSSCYNTWSIERRKERVEEEDRQKEGAPQNETHWT